MLGQSKFIILRRAYLDLVHGNHCAAKLIEYFKNWTDWKLKSHRTDWIYMPAKLIYDDLMGEHSVGVIRRALNLLIKLGILERRSNPGNFQDKTYQYRLNLSKVAEGASNPYTVPCVENDFSSVENDFSSVENDKHHNIQSIEFISTSFLATTTNAVVPKKDVEEEEQEIHTEWEASSLNQDLEVNQHLDLDQELNQEIKISHQGILDEVEFSEKSLQEEKTPDFRGLVEGVDPDSFDKEEIEQSRPDPDEFQASIRELQALKLTPALIINADIRAAMKKNWRQVPGAIAYLKEAVQTWKVKPDFNWGGLFVTACREGRKPEQDKRSSVERLAASEINPPNADQKKLLKDACTKGLIKEIFYSSVANCLKVALPNFKQMAWWEYLQNE